MEMMAIKLLISFLLFN